MTTRFEDIHAWQEARTAVKMIYTLTGTGAFAMDYGLCDQIRRSAVSVMANIAEGFDCDSKDGLVFSLQAISSTSTQVA